MNCPRCDGSGYISAYGHVARGVCFQCNGRGYVASNGKVAKSVKVKQIKRVLFGTTKAETKIVLDCVLSGSEYLLNGADPLFGKLVSLGHMEIVNNRYVPAVWFTRRSISILVDWNK